jgi:hypothetical protein
MYTQVTMRTNFDLASPDVIKNIRAELLEDVSLMTEFNQMLADPESCGLTLWQMFVQRISTLHGTELAAQMMDNLASSKRKASASKKSGRLGPQFTRPLQAKFEQLRAARKQKKIQRNFVQDLTLQPDTYDMTDTYDVTEQTDKHDMTEQLDAIDTSKLDYNLGDDVTALEGIGSATKQWKGVIVEIDEYSGCYIICCQGVTNYPHGYNMAIPFNESSSRINQPVHGGKRKRKRKVIKSM